MQSFCALAWQPALAAPAPWLPCDVRARAPLEQLDPIRNKLRDLTMLDNQNLDADPESKKLFESLGQPVKDMFQKE